MVLKLICIDGKEQTFLQVLKWLQKGFKGIRSDIIFYLVSIYDEKEEKIVQVSEIMNKQKDTSESKQNKTSFTNSPLKESR